MKSFIEFLAEVEATSKTVEPEEQILFQIYDNQTNVPIGKPTEKSKLARRRAEKLGLEYGSYNRYVVKRIKK